MDFDKFKSFIDTVDKKLIATHELSDGEKRSFIRVAKIMEELGELSQEILSYYGKGHPSKLQKFKKSDMEDEFADVLITLFLLAKAVDVDISESLDKKIKKIKVKLEMAE